MSINSTKPAWKHWLLGCIAIFALTILDQGSKYLVLTYLKGRPDINLIPEFFSYIILKIVEWHLVCLKVKSQYL